MSETLCSRLEGILHRLNPPEFADVHAALQGELQQALQVEGAPLSMPELAGALGRIQRSHRDAAEWLFRLYCWEERHRG